MSHHHRLCENHSRWLRELLAGKRTWKPTPSPVTQAQVTQEQRQTIAIGLVKYWSSNRNAAIPEFGMETKFNRIQRGEWDAAILRSFARGKLDSKTMRQMSVDNAQVVADASQQEPQAEQNG